jgi:hypothetical protein
MIGFGLLLILFGVASKYLRIYHHYDYITIGIGIISFIAGVVTSITGFKNKMEKK